MRLLLDTHVILWALADPERLTNEARACIEDGHNEVFVSAASVWEIAIKQATGRLRAPDDLLDVMASGGFASMPITAQHASAAGGLPMLHRDPFDRMLIAQAIVESIAIVTRDQRLAQYEVQLVAT